MDPRKFGAPNEATPRQQKKTRDEPLIAAFSIVVSVISCAIVALDEISQIPLEYPAWMLARQGKFHSRQQVETKK
ncbi:MAG: hypothetical protein QNK24_01120 [Desulfuromusa sp.]|nr:hypothetical protein [Desulfuromusa sp.]